MLRKDYIKFAKMIKELANIEKIDKFTLKIVMYGLSNILAEENNNFDRERFVSNCNIRE